MFSCLRRRSADRRSLVDRHAAKLIGLAAVSGIMLSWLSVQRIVGADAPRVDANGGAVVAEKPTFEHVGPQVGEQLPDLRLRTIKGEVQQFGDAWRTGPALVVTSSLTCPKSRSRWPELAAIAKKYGDKLNVVVLYVIEAHPVGSVCPYKGVEDITPENQRDGILRRQPKTLEDRLDLAQEFKRYLRIDVPIYVDMLDNRAWKAIGAAPNIALLVEEKTGVVAVRQGWFEGARLQKLIEDYLAKQPTEEKRQQKWKLEAETENAETEKLIQAGVSPNTLSRIVRGDKADRLEEVLKKAPFVAKVVVQPEQGHNDESTLLMDSAASGNLAAAEILLKYGADTRARTSSYDSPLQAARFDNLDIIKLLLKHNADVNYPTTGRTPLHQALIAGQSAAAKLLLDAGAKGDFYSDIGLGKIDGVRRSLMADSSRASRPDGASRMPLDYAAANDQLEIARLLIEKGAPVVDRELSAIEAPLHYAIRRGNLPMVKLLLEAGHSPNTAKGNRGEAATSDPAIHMAIRENRFEILQTLLSYKPDLAIRNTYSQTPLHYAADLGNAKMVKMLIQGGADVKATTRGFSLPCGSGAEETPQYNTPLHFAAAAGNPETIQELLAGGAELEALNADEKTPLMCALSPPIYTGINDKKQAENIEVLIASGANLNRKDKEGRSLIDLASGYENYSMTQEERTKHQQMIIELLKKHGAVRGG